MTRARGNINNVEKQIKRHVGTYRTAFLALQRLDPTGSWKDTYQELRDEDNRGPTFEADEVEQEIQLQRKARRVIAAEKAGFRLPTLTQRHDRTEGRYTQSWIWRRAHGQDKTQFHEQVRCEWMRAQARAERWEEELCLLEEEMRRTLTSLRARSERWAGKAKSCNLNGLEDHATGGLRAYAAKQADVYFRLVVHFSYLWETHLRASSTAASWNADVLSWIKKVSEGTSNGSSTLSSDSNNDDDDDDGDNNQHRNGVAPAYNGSHGHAPLSACEMEDDSDDEWLDD
jgi:hypothetical protein